MLEGEYKAICLDNYNGRLHVVSKSFRSLQYKEILVKIHFASIHPFDLQFIKGDYGDLEPTKFPIVPGFEGSGEIIAVGDPHDNHLINKRVACFANSNKEGYFEGVWAEYHYTTQESIMIFDKPIPCEKISSIINPIMAVGMLDTVKKTQSTSVLHDGAETAVGKIFTKLCKKENIQSINLVKNYQHCKEFSSLGITNIIVMEEDWELECVKLTNFLNTQIAFDCLGGDMTSKILSILPEDSILYHYGKITQKEISKIVSNELIFKGKTITGWWMVRWLRSLSAVEYEYYWEYIRNEYLTSNLFETNILKIFGIDDFYNAITFFSNNLTEGNVLFAMKATQSS